MNIFLDMANTFKVALLKRQLYNHVNELIDKKDSYSILIFLEKGYQPDEKQLSKLMLFKEPIIHQDTIDNMHQLYTNKYQEGFINSFAIINNLYDKYVKQCSKNGYFHEAGDYEKWKKTQKRFFSDVVTHSQPDICHFILQYSPYKAFFKENEETLVAHSGLNSSMKNIEQLKYVLSHTEFAHLAPVLDNYKNIHKILIEQTPRIRQYRKEVKDIAYQAKRLQKEQNIEQYDVLFSKEVKVKPVEKLELSPFPYDSHAVIESIHKNYESIPVDTLTIEQKLEVENIYKVRFPQLLEQYKKLTPEYKNACTQEDSPDTLLLESLNKIDSNIARILQAYNQDNHNKLKVTHRYFGSI